MEQTIEVLERCCRIIEINQSEHILDSNVKAYYTESSGNKLYKLGDDYAFFFEGSIPSIYLFGMIFRDKDLYTLNKMCINHLKNISK